MHALLAAIAAADHHADARRLFHGRGGLHPGAEAWSLDLLPPAALLTSHRPADDAELAAVHAALAAAWPRLLPGMPLTWVHQCRHEGRTGTRTMAGALPAPHLVREDGLRFEVQLGERGPARLTGFFLDMAEGRRWLRAQVAARPGARVLNLFA